MENSTVKCTKCGAKNRLGVPKPDGVPVCGQCKNPLPWIVEGTDAGFAGDLEASVPVLVDFWADWCAPCRMTAPALESLAGDQAGRIKIVKVDVDRNPQTAGRYNIRSIPTLILFRNGQAVETLVGAQSKDALLRQIGRHLA
jgi:thioredoxin 2